MIGFRRRRRMGLVDLTLTNRGAGLSTGKRGARVSANTRGRRGFSLSALGFFWRRSR